MKKQLKRILCGAAILIILIAVYMLSDGFGEKKSNSDTSRDFIKTTFVRVVDGDTIVVALSDENIKVRLIGIDAPESVHSDESKNTEEGELSTEYLKSILAEGDKLYLQYDVEKKDIYGRTLAYVWISDKVDINRKEDIENYMLNAILVKEGYAKAMEYPPNTRYHYIFESFAG